MHGVVHMALEVFFFWLSSRILTPDSRYVIRGAHY